MNRKSTAAEKRHMGKVAMLGCLIHAGTPAQVHHLTTVTPRNNMLVIPLCPECHTGAFSIHKTKHEFLKLYGSEWLLLADTLRRLT